MLLHCFFYVKMLKTENKNANCKIAGDIGIDTEMLSSLLESSTGEMERKGLNHVRKRKNCEIT